MLSVILCAVVGEKCWHHFRVMLPLKKMFFFFVVVVVFVENTCSQIPKFFSHFKVDSYKEGAIQAFSICNKDVYKALRLRKSRSSCYIWSSFLAR